MFWGLVSLFMATVSNAAFQPVDNLLDAETVNSRVANGSGTVLRLECDFVTCTQ